jgi:hypothetical protein
VGGAVRKETHLLVRRRVGLEVVDGARHRVEPALRAAREQDLVRHVDHQRDRRRHPLRHERLRLRRAPREAVQDPAALGGRDGLRA